MKILLYNWVMFDDEKDRGGGVTVYLRNLIEKLITNFPNIDVNFLTSGSYYDIYDKSLRYEKIDNIWGSKCKSYAIINSPIFSPAYLSFSELDIVLNDDKLKIVFADFLDNQGPFDIVHFHNLEGLSLNVLENKHLFLGTKFIYSLHNYYAFCPQVNLWKNELCNCMQVDTGEACMECMRQHVPHEKLRYKMAMTFYLRKHPSKILENAYQECGKRLDEYFKDMEKSELCQEEKEKVIDALSLYRKKFINMLNVNMDCILAVSKRVKQIALNMGIEEEKVSVSYIGTKAAEYAKSRINCFHEGEPISIVFMGYQRKDKGFFFLVEALNQLEPEIAKKISVTLAAKKTTKENVYIDSKKFFDYRFQNGYIREEISELLKDKHLGIVPVLWEDNLPQVAIEMVANGVPILSSDRGGASELSTNKDFCFEAGNITEFINKLTYLINNPKVINDFWDGYVKLNTTEDHIMELLNVYSNY